MALFRYAAINGEGKKSKGTILARSLQEAKQKLYQRGVLITDIDRADAIRQQLKLSKQEVCALTREWARLLKADLPLYETLAALEEKYRGHKAHELLLLLSEKIRAGEPFSRALETHPHCFDMIYCSVIANAEKSGDLAAALQDLEKLLQRQLQLRKQLMGALLYPALLGAFCCVVLGLLLFYVVPSLFELFEGRSLHPFTRFVFACSQLAIKGKYVLALGVSLMGALTVWSFTSKQGLQILRKILVRLPWVKELLVKIALVRFFRAAASLIEGGLPALTALQQARLLLNHPTLEASIGQALLKLTEGAPLHESLRDAPLIPPLVPRMLGIAQEGGNLSLTMNQLASIYEEDLEELLAKITALAQPILLLILGAMVGFVLLSVLLPLTDVSAFAT